MTRWRRGEAEVERFLAARQLQKVATDAGTPLALLAAATKHVQAAEREGALDPEGAFSLAYDAARKAATALLAHQGLRPTSTGGHVVVADVMRVQFPGVPGLASLDRLRRRRNQAEYPQPESYDPIRADEVEDAVRVARACLDSVTRLVESDEIGMF